jgi:hypothetical protein
MKRQGVDLIVRDVVMKWNQYWDSLRAYYEMSVGVLMSDENRTLRVDILKSAMKNHMFPRMFLVMLSCALYCDKQCELMEMIGEGNIDLNAVNPSSQTALQLAVSFCRKSIAIECIKILANTDGVNLDPRDDDGWTPLMYAAQWCDNDSIECVKVLLKAGANVNAVDLHGVTALHAASTMECIKLLAHWPSTTHFTVCLFNLQSDPTWIFELIISRLNENRFEMLKLNGIIPGKFQGPFGNAVRRTTRLLEFDVYLEYYNLMKGNYSIVEVEKLDRVPKWAIQQAERTIQQAERNAFALERCTFTVNWNTLKQWFKEMIGRDMAALLMRAIWETRGDGVWSVKKRFLFDKK